MTAYAPPQSEKPSLVTAIAVLTLISGIVNVFWGFVATISVTATVIFICLVPLTILPAVLGVFEILYAARLLSESRQPMQPSQSIAILEILCVLAGNVFSMIVGILSLVFYNDPVVKEYFAGAQGMVFPPASALTAGPVAEPPAPVLTEPAAPTAEPKATKKPRRGAKAAKSGDSSS